MTFCFRSADCSYNHVDRVRVSRSSTQIRDCPNRGSGWRHKSISHSDLITPKSTTVDYSQLRSSRSLDWNNNIEFQDFLSHIEPEKDYDDYYNENSENNKNEPYNQLDIGNDSCSLRRTRSLAVIREETYNDLQIPSNNARRSQLIPRAKLVNPSFFRKRFHQKQQRREEDSAGSGVETQTSETRESDEYYANLKRLDSVKIVPSPWQNDKSDLESLNSDYFKNSSHQSNQQDEESRKHQYKQKRDRCSRAGRNRFQVLEIETHHENSQSSAFPETTPSNSDQSDTSSDQLEDGDVEKEEISSVKQIDKVEEVHVQEVLKIGVDQTTSGSLTFTKDEKGLKPFIAYDSVYLSSEESSDGTVIEETFTEELNEIVSAVNSESASLVQISIEDEFNEEILKEDIFTEETKEIYTEVKKSNTENSPKTKPKILSVEKKLKTLSDYAKTTRRGVLEHLTYISTSQVLKANEVSIIDSFRSNLPENHYHSLPDINIGKSLKVSERIDAQLRSTYNFSHSESIENCLTGDQTAIYDSINKFGRAHKRARQREYGEIDSLIKSHVPSVNEIKVEVLEQPREAPTIEVKAACKEKEVNNNEVPLGEAEILGVITSAPFKPTVIETERAERHDKKEEQILCRGTNNPGLSNFQINQTTNNFPDQFRIIVTDVQNNVIEEDSIESVLSNEDDDKKNKQKAFNVSNPKREVVVSTSEERKDIDKKVVDKDKKLESNQIKIPSIEKAEKNIVNKSHLKGCPNTTNIFKAQPVKLYSNDVVKSSKTKMSRPQILHVIDSKRCHNSTTPDNAKGTENGGVKKEFQEKVDSMRCYWSKLIQNGKDSGVDTTDNGTRNFVTSVEDEISETSGNPSTEINQPITENQFGLQSFTPTVEIVELDGQKQATIVKASNTDHSEFDHVRYKVMKSNLFRNNMLTRSTKEAQFDGLLQYLQDYSFQELLTNNNVVIIEPIRTKIEKPSQGQAKPHTVNCKITGGSGTDSKSTAKRHFFYHPVRVNRELLEDELPNPDTVRNVRKIFEGNNLHKKPQSKTTQKLTDNISIPSCKRRSLRYLTIDTSYGGLRKWDSASLSSGISSGDLSSPCECNESEQDRVHVKAQNGQDEELYSSEENLCDDELCESYYVSEDVLEKIRECGSTVTYYGGRVVDNKSQELSPMTRTIIQEIKGKDIKCSACQPNDCPQEKDIQQSLPNKSLGVKFKLVKSNSCSSRLELVGTEKQNDSATKAHNFRQARLASPPTEPEETVRDLVNRLESGGINKAPVPRIIESQCIEKAQRNGPPIPSSLESHKVSPDSVTINNHLIGETTGLVDIIKQVTVNNHITFCQSACNVKTCPGEKVTRPPARDNKRDEETSKNPMKKVQIQSGDSKVCRNKNVDLALNMTKSCSDKTKFGAGKDRESDFGRTPPLPPGTDVSINKGETLKDEFENPQGLSSLDTNKTIASLSNPAALKCEVPYTSSNAEKREGFTGNGVHKVNSITNKIENNKSKAEASQDKITMTFKAENRDEKLTSAISKNDSPRETIREHGHNEEQKTKNVRRSSKVEVAATEKSFVKHYVANDRNLVVKKKYDDIEFEEFEVYDPTSVTLDKPNDLSGRNNNNTEDCYDSLDDKV